MSYRVPNLSKNFLKGKNLQWKRWNITQVILYPFYVYEDNTIFTEKGQETLAVELLFKWFEYFLSLPYRLVDNDTFLVLLSAIIRG